ncbi:MAG: hypothetical protein JRH18_13545 [Deltaproteobacteria bacterium]|nr:hypothetical protein [Deltaproteobacteria bacterium]MBW1961514.1 hypothetical protein [Deltaproteobacteria bacterium]MBW1994936.1 hypothetical protein [Deltaproteobacteria bacterium]MBW2152679.1 hypothetical protein [Deltaproteobacteria bacterium]
MENLKIYLYETGKTKPETIITIPLTVLHIAQPLIPSRVKESLKREGIDIDSLSELASKKGPKGTLIEIESSKEKLVISID